MAVGPGPEIPAEPKSVDEALLIFQADLPVLKKDRDGQVGNQKTKYADLTQANEVVLPRLNALGCIWTCSPIIAGSDPGRFVLHWELRHVPSGTLRSGQFPILGDSPMKHGAAITYARRYALLAVTGVIPEDEDDDGRSFEDGHAVARRAASGRARQAQRPPAGQVVDPPRRSNRAAAPPLPGDDEPPPPAEGEPPAPQSSGVRPDQHRAMHAAWRELGFVGDENRDNRLMITRNLLHLPELNSSADLTAEQADTVIAALRDRITQRKGSDQ